MKQRPAIAIVIWLALLVSAIAVVARARYTTDLSAFLPRAPTPAQQLLVNQLRDGLTSRLLLIGIEGADPAARARASRALAVQLRNDSGFVRVSNGDASGQERDLEFLLEHRYVLSGAVNVQRFTAEGLRTAIQSTIELLTSPAGSLIKPYVTRDPTGELLQLLDQLDTETGPASSDGVWTSQDGNRAILIAETVAAGSDLVGQQRAIETINRSWRSIDSQSDDTSISRPSLSVSGTAAFAVAARDTIRNEAVRLSLLSSALIAAWLWFVYRSMVALLLGLLPVACGALAGVAAVALGYDAVHGVTLGFGITLIGESVDYSIYQFIQSRTSTPERDSARHQQALWRTIGLGVATSVCGFASLLPSAFPGISQLGLYSIAGLVAAAAVTRWVLPQLLPATFAIRDLTPLARRAARILRPTQPAQWSLLVLAGLCVAVLYQHRDSLWNRELAALSPVPIGEQMLDAQLRADLGVADVRYLIVATGPDMEAALRTSEQVGAQLEPLIASGEIDGYQSPAQYMPSLATQRARIDSLPASQDLRARLASATAGLPLRARRLDAFVAEVDAARKTRPATRADLTGTSLAAAVDALLFRSGSQWQALMPLRAPAEGPHPFEINPQPLRSALARVSGGSALLVDIKQESDSLYSSYQTEAAWLSFAGLLFIVLLLLAALRSVRRVARIVAPLLLSVLTVATGLVLAGVALTIMHLVGMLLIVAIGSNYALFFDRKASDGGVASVPLMLASVVIANAATVVGFGVLASSSVPVLQALGITVGPGALLALLFAVLLTPAGVLNAPAVRSS